MLERFLLPLVAAAAAAAASGAAAKTLGEEDTRFVLLLKHRVPPARLAEVEAALGLGPNATGCSNCVLNRRPSAAAAAATAARPAFATDVVPVRCGRSAASAAASSSVAAFAAAGLGCGGTFVEAAERWVGSVVVDRKVPVPSRRALLQRSARRDVFNGGSVDVVRTLRVDKYFWRAAAGEGAAAASDATRTRPKEGVKGAGVRVAIFDTGIVRDHPHFAGAKVATCVDYTESGSCHDGFGHGSFVAGLIASRGDCLGMAPEAELHVFKVFTDQQVSYTSWFLDAFNHALDLDIDVLNLSIGGPDYMDAPFTDKVREVVANGVTVVSAIGNDGPLFGTLNNPADMLEVVGVGAVDADKHVASFSSRGMTTWELPQGYGRIKPDVLTYGENLRSTASTGGCRELSGTSVASPVVAGVATEVVAYLRSKGVKESLINPGTVKKVLTSSTRLLDNVSVYEQGTGLLNVADVMANLKKGVEVENGGGGSGSSSSSSAAGQFTLDAPVFLPSALRLEQCKLFWPLCRHPVYATGMPVVLNLTVVNPSSLAATLTETAWQVTGVSQGDEQLSADDAAFFADNVEIGVEASARVYPYFGWLSLSVTLARPLPKALADAAGARAAKPGEGGFVVRGLFTAVLRPERGRARKLLLDLSFRVVETPPREKRVLWDVFHSMQYPPAYIARDDLSRTSDVLDWNGDHPHTNFKDTFDHVTGEGYFVELLSDSFLAFDAAHYGVLMLVDAEEEYSDEEAAKFEADVRERGLGVLVFAEWHNAELMEKANFVDSNTREMWSPLVGGANLPALNELLAPFGIALSASVYHGAAKLSPTLSVLYKSGCAIQTFPRGGQVFVSESPLTDMVQKAREPRKRRKAGKPPPSAQGVERVPILGLTGKGSVGRGRIGVYGDSGCLDSAHSDRRFCFNLVDALLSYAAAGAYAPSLTASGSFRGGGGLDGLYVNPVAAPPLPARPSTNPLLPHSHALGGDKDRRVGRHSFRAIPHTAPLALLGGPAGTGGGGNSSGGKRRHHSGSSSAPKKKKAKVIRAVKVVRGKEGGGGGHGGRGVAASDDDDSVVTNPPDRVRRLALVHARGLTVLLAATVLVVCAYFCSRRRRRRRRKPGGGGGGGGSSLPL